MLRSFAPLVDNELLTMNTLANIQFIDRCQRCGEGRLRSWQELSEEEREVVRRLPASAEYTKAEREARHRWCTRCWNESTDNAEKQG